MARFSDGWGSQAMSNEPPPPKTFEGMIKGLWIDGYQEAVDAMRDWANTFTIGECKQTILHCADMVEAAKPPK